MRLNAVDVTLVSCRQRTLPTGALPLNAASFRVPEALTFLILAQPELTRRLSAQFLKLLVSFAVQANLEICRRRRRRSWLVPNALQESGRHMERRYASTAQQVSSPRHSSLWRVFRVCEGFTLKWTVRQAATAVRLEK